MAGSKVRAYTNFNSNNYERLENQDTDFIEIDSDEQENVEAKDKPKENISNSSKSA